jgi:beta-lactamase class A
MKLYRKFVSAVCLAASVLSVNAQNSAVQEAIDKFVSAPSLRNGSVGVQVVSLDSMKVMGEFNPYQSEITASTMKTVASATALHLL